jgi:hypothetical protein
MTNHKRRKYVQKWHYKMGRDRHPGGGRKYYLENTAGTQTRLLEELLKTDTRSASAVYGVARVDSKSITSFAQPLTQKNTNNIQNKS